MYTCASAVLGTLCSKTAVGAFTLEFEPKHMPQPNTYKIIVFLLFLGLALCKKPKSTTGVWSVDDKNNNAYSLEKFQECTSAQSLSSPCNPKLIAEAIDQV